MHKLACNHLIATDSPVFKSDANDKQILWNGLDGTTDDGSMGEPKMEKFSARFKVGAVQLEHIFGFGHITIGVLVGEECPFLRRESPLSCV